MNSKKQKLSTSLSENIRYVHNIFPIGTSFDFVTRDLLLGETKAYWIGINGFYDADLLQKIFANLQTPSFMTDTTVDNIKNYMDSKIGYSQAVLTDDWDTITTNILSGPSVLFIDGFAEAIILDVRSYPTRGIEEPDTEKVTRGARDGFVETMLLNINLIRRRIRTSKLTFEIHSIGEESKTDVSVAYVEGTANEEVLNTLRQTLDSLDITTLTLGTKSLEELLVKKRWFNPLPSIQITERPDVACSYLSEGHILLLVDNSPTVMILPSTIFQFTQSPEDYYKNPVIGNYFRFIRFGCILISLFMMPAFLLTAAYFPEHISRWHMTYDAALTPATLIFYVLLVEFLLDLFKYSASLSSSGYSGSLSIVGGLIIGDVAVRLNWATMEILFYAAITLLTSLALSSVEFSDAIKIYRVFLVITTGFLGLWGFIGGIILIIISSVTTPTFAKMSYFWPLFPFNWDALKTLLFRYPTTKAQPCQIWKREKK